MTPAQFSEESLGRAFFERPPDDVARDLVGALLIVRDQVHDIYAKVVETEAYGGSDDLASHAYRGPTKRCEVMFGPPGYLYVYRIYGLHWCMNVVTESDGVASAVLLRAAEVLDGPLSVSRPPQRIALLRGPGNLTRGLGISGIENGVDCCQGSISRIRFHGPSGEGVRQPIAQSRRIGLTKAQDRLSRYFLEGHPAVTKVPFVMP